MRALRRTTLSFALTLAPILGTGCVSMSPKVTYSRAMQQRDQKMNTARLEESRGNLESCKGLYEEIYLQNPSYFDCIHRLAVVSTRLNRHNEAEAYFQQANALQPNDPEILADMGFAAFMRKDYEQSEALLEQSIRLRGHDRRIITNLAIVQAWRSKDDSSLTNFRKVKGEPDALRSLAAIQVARGDHESAKRLYDLASIAGPETALNNPGIAQASALDLPSPQSDIPPSPEPLQQKSSATPGLLVTTRSSHETIAILPPPPRKLGLKEALFSETSPPEADLVPPSPIDTVPNDTAPIYSPPSCTRVAPADISYPPAVPPVAAPLPPDSEGPASHNSQSTVPLIAPAPPEPSQATSKLPVEVTIAANSLSAKDSDRQPKQLDIEVMLPPVIATAVPQPHQTQTAAAQPELAFHTPSVWRRTPVSRGGPSEEIPVKFETESTSQISPIISHVDNATSVWSICLVTLLEEKRLEPSRTDFSMEYMSHQYRFSTAEALEKFRAAPQVYAPVAGGLDIVAVRNERSVIEGSLNFALWYRRQLYLFSSREHAESFRREPHKYASLN